MPGSRIRSGLASVACSWIVRVEGSICGSIVVSSASNTPLGEGVDADLDRLAHLDLRAALLRQGEVDIERVEVGEGDQRGPRPHILAGLDLADPEPAGERRLDPLLVDGGPDPGHVGARLVELRLILVQGRLGGEIAAGEALRASEVRLGEPCLGLEAAQLGPLDARH